MNSNLFFNFQTTKWQKIYLYARILSTERKQIICFDLMRLIWPDVTEAGKLVENVGEREMLLHLVNVEVEILRQRLLGLLPHHQAAAEEVNQSI